MYWLLHENVSRGLQETNPRFLPGTMVQCLLTLRSWNPYRTYLLWNKSPRLVPSPIFSGGQGLVPPSEDRCPSHGVRCCDTTSLLSGFRRFKVEQELRFLQTKPNQHLGSHDQSSRLFTQVSFTLHLTEKQITTKPTQSELSASLPKFVFIETIKKKIHWLIQQIITSITDINRLGRENPLSSRHVNRRWAGGRGQRAAFLDFQP